MTAMIAMVQPRSLSIFICFLAFQFCGGAGFRFAKDLQASSPEVAPKVGLEPTTDRLTADCSTIELLWIPLSQMGRVIYKRIPVASTGFSPANMVACKDLRAAGLLPGCFASRSYRAQGSLSNDGRVRLAPPDSQRRGNKSTLAWPSPSGRGKADGFQWPSVVNSVEHDQLLFSGRANQGHG